MIIYEYSSVKYNIGEVFLNKLGDRATIIGKSSKPSKYWVEFDNTKYRREVSTTNLKTGAFKDLYEPSVYSIGYIGKGKYNRKSKSYDAWMGILNRCYSGRDTSYYNVSICNKWNNFQIFSEWFDENYVEGYEIDKDFLQLNIDNKIYSPSTCVFIPKNVNNFLKNNPSKNTSGITGVSWNKKARKWRVRIKSFKTKKEIHLGYFDNKELAEESYLNEKNNQFKILIEYLKIEKCNELTIEKIEEGFNDLL